MASDGVNADVEQSVSFDVNNLDEVAPSIILVIQVLQLMKTLVQGRLFIQLLLRRC